ncbi:MAG: hypothetical protein ACF8GE_11430 [Phycisphaerales bacterium JB043]
MAWSLSLSRAFAARDLGYSMRTLFVSPDPELWGCAESTERIAEDKSMATCVLDPGSPPHEIIDLLYDSLAGLEPDLVILNSHDACYAAAARLRGAKRIAVAHADSVYYRRLIEQYCYVDAAVSVNDTIHGWLEPILAGRPVHKIDRLAGNIATLSDDRLMHVDLLDAVWEPALYQSAELEVEQYRELFDEVLALPVRDRLTDCGARLTVMEGPRTALEIQPERVEEWARLRLRDAGYTAIGLDHPEPGNDAVVVRREASVDTEQVARWRRSGLGVVRVPDLIDESIVERMERLVCSAVARGRRRIAVYGIGQHTQRARDLFSRELPFICFIDDSPERPEQFMGLPTVPLAGVRELKPDAILLSSDAWEAEMIERCCESMPGIEVIPVYEWRISKEHARQTAGAEEIGVACTDGGSPSTLPRST